MNTKFTSLVISIALFAGLNAKAQITPTPVSDTIDINDISALMYADGMDFWNQKTGLPFYKAPKTGNVCSIFDAGIWIGGLDVGGKLHMAASTYKQRGTDFWPGPIMDSLNYSSHQDTLWNKIWKVNKSTIDSFRQGKCVGIPASIKNWPGDGNVALGEMAHLAPYVDSNHNGYYDPAGGDYPLIRGDQAMYMIYNDDRGFKHGESGGIKMGIEVHLMAYQFNTPADSVVNQTTFLHYDIYNLSTNAYDSVYLGYWCDMDVGNGGMNYLGCDSANNYWYTYECSNSDPDGSGQFAGENGYLNHLPAQAVAYLCDSMSHFMYYRNDFTVMGNPKADTASSYYGYLKNMWLDSTHVTYGGNGYGGSTKSNYFYSGNPVTLSGWTEPGDGDPCQDVRGLSSMGPLTFAAGKALTMDIALVFAQTTIPNNQYSVAALGPDITHVRGFYSAQGYGCSTTLLGINEPKAEQNVVAKLYPNPFNKSATLFVNTELKNAELNVYDMFGREVYNMNNIYTQYIPINRNQLANGMYFYTITNDGARVANGKFIIQ
ncbi:MAG TPA: T9SS type A sorting domain-containing protein [Bacteroidia bacterium]|jgi:hypothetical protein|nr:T9SS type A sorting domain-containing protein [Bacteroidia bacterium]